MAERSKAAVLKTVEVRASGGSNPSLPAIRDICFLAQTSSQFLSLNPHA